MEREYFTQALWRATTPPDSPANKKRGIVRKNTLPFYTS